jgi:hypothetical protein
MTWVNSPPCVNPNCTGNEHGKLMKNEGVRGPVTEDEKRGGAGRVESEFSFVLIRVLFLVLSRLDGLDSLRFAIHSCCWCCYLSRLISFLLIQ